MNDFYGLKNGWNLYWMLPTNVNFAENWTKKKQFMLVSFKTNPQIKCSSHNLKPYFIYFEYEIYSSSTTFKPYKC
jgi:hypothetical protein